MNTSGRSLLALTTKRPPMSSINHGGGKRRSSMVGSGGLHNPHAARSTLTTLNRGSRSTWIFKANPPAKRLTREDPPRFLRLPQYPFQPRLSCCRGSSEEVFVSLDCVSHARSRSKPNKGEC